jgi:hypothetical protein
VTFAASSTAIPGTYSVVINGTFGSTSTKTAAISITITQVGQGTTWFVRPDGGTRYDASVSDGQCNGKYDAPYPGSGVNQNCAFNDIRYLWDDGNYGNWGWIIAGGDTVVIRGCAAAVDQQNPDAPHCRIGWDTANGPGSLGWCAGAQSNNSCYNPTIPPGTATHHTRILGACAYGTYSCNSGTAIQKANLTQLFGGFGVGSVIGLQSTQYVDIEGLELTTHNGACSRVGAPSYPRGCNSGVPLDDYASQGITTDNKTANVLLQDVYVHGMSSNGLFGPIGGAIAMTRVQVNFNAFAGWNFDDGSDTPDAAGSSINASYVTMMGNGCMEEYPIVHTQYPALSCWDASSGGFGDSWSGQDTELDSFVCDHCVDNYNTKDAFIGPHTNIKNLTITNSEAIGNMGQSWKWGSYPGGAVTFENNLTVGDCFRMSEQLPGAAQNFNESTGVGGSYLSEYCRAAGMVFGVIAAPNSTWTVAGNTIVSYQPSIFVLNCTTAGACGTAKINFRDNLVLGYTTATNYFPGASGEAPGLYYLLDNSITYNSANSLEFGIRDGDNCGSNGIICSDPLLVDEPLQGSVPPETTLDNFNFNVMPGSPAVHAGVAVPGLVTDFNGVTRPDPPSIGALEP